MQEAEAAKLIKQGKKIFEVEGYPELIDFSNDMFFDPTYYDEINYKNDDEFAAMEVLYKIEPTSAAGYIDVYNPKSPPPLYVGLTLASNRSSKGRSRDIQRSTNTACYVSGCTNHVIGQCTGYPKSCGRFYCREHSSEQQSHLQRSIENKRVNVDTLCSECAKRKLTDTGYEKLLEDLNLERFKRR
jgi:hypothetical protein